MSKLKFRLNRPGVRKLLKSEEVKAIIKEEASEIQARCGDGYAQDIHDGKNRVNAMVWAKSKKAKQDNLKNNTILKALRKKG